MKAILFASMLALTSVSDVALAADMPVKAPPRAAPMTTCIFCGFYLGGHGGGMWSRDRFDGEFSDAFGEFKINGAFIGGHFGHNWQTASPNWIVGIEVDGDAGLGKRRNQLIEREKETRLDLVRVRPEFSSEVRPDIFGTARMRLGYLLSPSLMLFGTAGLAWGHVKADIVETGGLIVVPASLMAAPVERRSITFSAASNHFGWVAGGGIEWAWTPNLFFRVQGLHRDLSDVSYSFPVVTTKGRLTSEDVSGGLSYRF